MKKMICGILKNENIVKNIFTGIGYFVLIAGVGEALRKYLLKEIGVITAFILFSYIAIFFLAILFWIVHVVRPVVKITWVDFGIPGVDEESKPISFKEIFKRTDIIVFMTLALMSIYASHYLTMSLLNSVH